MTSGTIALIRRSIPCFTVIDEMEKYLAEKGTSPAKGGAKRRTRNRGGKKSRR